MNHPDHDRVETIVSKRHVENARRELSPGLAEVEVDVDLSSSPQ